MNIFYLSSIPSLCAEWAVDRHVIKMILETGQLLSTAHRVLDGVKTVKQVPTKTQGKWRKKTLWCLPIRDGREHLLYAATHINHPCAVWARESSANYNWLWELLDAYCKEYTCRYGKIHKVESSGLKTLLSVLPRNIHSGKSFNEPPICMDEKYNKYVMTIDNYRNYYANGKRNLHKWKNRQEPYWIKYYQYEEPREIQTLSGRPAISRFA